MSEKQDQAKPMAALNQELRDEAENTGEQLGERAREQVAAGQEKLREARDQIGAHMRHTGEQIQDGVGTAKQQSQDFVRDNPGLALIGALGVGVLLGMALRDRY